MSETVIMFIKGALDTKMNIIYFLLTSFWLSSFFGKYVFIALICFVVALSFQSQDLVLLGFGRYLVRLFWSYRVKMIIKTENQVTLTLMRRQAEELFNSKCEKLLEKKFYPTEQSLPEEIVDKVGQAHLFEIKVNQNRDFMVKSITPDTPNTPEERD